MLEIDNSLRFLHPIAIAPFVRLQTLLAQAWDEKKIRVLFLPFESYRTPHRQDKLKRDPRGVTKAGPWTSAHQFGLAVDFVPFHMTGRTGWSWDDDEPWADLKQMAKACGLEVPLAWDQAHVVHPAWYKVKNTLDKFPIEIPTAPVK